jgi:hypothetical protein
MSICRRILLVCALAGAAVAFPQGASAYYIDGCNEYDPERGLYHWCTPEPSTFYSPHGEDPAWYGPEYSGACDPYSGSHCAFGSSEQARPDADCMDDPTATSAKDDRGETHGTAPECGSSYGGIPPPAAYDPSKDYCSDPWFNWSPFEGHFNPGCYRHDVCYGSQLGRLYCDTRLWKDLQRACKDHFGIWSAPASRYWCLATAREWYAAVRHFGESSYKPRTSGLQP